MQDMGGERFGTPAPLQELRKCGMLKIYLPIVCSVN